MVVLEILEVVLLFSTSEAGLGVYRDCLQSLESGRNIDLKSSRTPEVIELHE